MAELIKRTWNKNVLLDIGMFTNVIRINGTGIAMTTDGVGTKSIIAEIANKYDTIGIDCVAMNVNDLLCVGATPISMVDYITTKKWTPVDEIIKGFVTGAELANISLIGGKTAELNSFDISGTAIGTVHPNKTITGRGIVPGDLVIGIESNGIHCNGLTLARLSLARPTPQKRRIFSERILKELLRPTHIYVNEILDLLEQNVPVKGLINITAGGLYNLSRMESDVGFVINNMPEIPLIFQTIQQMGDISNIQMDKTYNMGIGFCIIIPESVEEKTKQIIRHHSKLCRVIGKAIESNNKEIHIMR